MQERLRNTDPEHPSYMTLMDWWGGPQTSISVYSLGFTGEVFIAKGNVLLYNFGRMRWQTWKCAAQIPSSGKDLLSSWEECG